MKFLWVLFKVPLFLLTNRNLYNLILMTFCLKWSFKLLTKFLTEHFSFYGTTFLNGKHQLKMLKNQQEKASNKPSELVFNKSTRKESLSIWLNVSLNISICPTVMYLLYLDNLIWTFSTDLVKFPTLMYTAHMVRQSRFSFSYPITVLREVSYVIQTRIYNSVELVAK